MHSAELRSPYCRRRDCPELHVPSCLYLPVPLASQRHSTEPRQRQHPLQLPYPCRVPASRRPEQPQARRRRRDWRRPACLSSSSRRQQELRAPMRQEHLLPAAPQPSWPSSLPPQRGPLLLSCPCPCLPFRLRLGRPSSFARGTCAPPPAPTPRHEQCAEHADARAAACALRAQKRRTSRPIATPGALCTVELQQCATASAGYAGLTHELRVCLLCLRLPCRILLICVASFCLQRGDELLVVWVCGKRASAP